MRMDRFTTLAQHVLAHAQSMAVSASNAELSPMHLLAAMLEEEDGVAGSILARAGIDGGRIREVTTAELKRLPTVSGTTPQTSQSFIQVTKRGTCWAFANSFTARTTPNP